MYKLPLSPHAAKHSHTDESAPAHRLPHTRTRPIVHIMFLITALFACFSACFSAYRNGTCNRSPGSDTKGEGRSSGRTYPKDKHSAWKIIASKIKGLGHKRRLVLICQLEAYEILLNHRLERDEANIWDNFLQDLLFLRITKEMLENYLWGPHKTRMRNAPKAFILNKLIKRFLECLRSPKYSTQA